MNDDRYDDRESMRKHFTEDGTPRRLNAALPEIAAISERLVTQNNRITENPMFCVQQRRSKRSHYETVMVCFTEGGAQEYLRQDGHNLREPRIYVESFNRCPEMIAIRDVLIANKTLSIPAP